MSKGTHLALFYRHRNQGEVVVNPNEVHDEYREHLGVNGLVATMLTSIYGSMWFVYFLALGMVVWMVGQTLLGQNAFDPYPFLLALFIGNLIQLLGGPIIQVGQNLASAHSELRAESDYHVNRESLEILERIEDAQTRVEQALERIDKRIPPTRLRKITE